MRIFTAEVGRNIQLGITGENIATQVVFPVVQDYKKTYGEGTFQLEILSPNTTLGYFAIIDVDDEKVSWVVENGELIHEGLGEARLIYTVGDTIAKSQKYVTEIHKDNINAEEGSVPPDPYSNWWTDLTQKATQVSADASYAANARDDAEGYAEDARTYAEEIENMSATATELPEGSSPTASYEDGVLTIGIPKSSGGVKPEDFVAHVNDHNVHVTSAEKEVWNSKSEFSGDYDDLENKPTLFDGNYNSLSNKPTLFDGNYNSLSNKPTLFSGDYNDLTNKPVIPEPQPYTLPIATDTVLGGVKIGNNLSITDDGTLSASGEIGGSVEWTDVLNKPTEFTPSAHTHSYNSLTDKPTLFDGNYNSLSNKPTLFSGDYNDLINKPSIPSTEGLATEIELTSHTSNDNIHVTSAEKEVWNSKSEFSGDYDDLANKPTLFSGDYNDLTNKPDPYTLPEATPDILGGIRLGSGFIKKVEQGKGTVVSVPQASTTSLLATSGLIPNTDYKILVDLSSLINIDTDSNRVDVIGGESAFILGFKGTEHDTYIYGGRDSSNVSIGCYDDKNDKVIWRYNDSTKLLELADSVSFGSNQLNDFVVEQGTKDGWGYRKWNSGAAECWIISTATVAINSASGNVYYGDGSAVNFPFTFKAVPSMTALMSQTSTTTAWMSVISLSTSSFVPRLFRGGSANSASYRYSAYVCGKWK